MASNLGRALNRGHKQTDVIIMDFAKAFAKVSHRRLLYKLDYNGIDRIYDGAEAETTESQASFQILQVSAEALPRMRLE